MSNIPNLHVNYFYQTCVATSTNKLHVSRTIIIALMSLSLCKMLLIKVAHDDQSSFDILPHKI